jgi:hypothetical protein
LWVLMAGAVAMCASLLELVTARKRPPPLRAVHWVMLRIGVDALVGAVAYPVTKAVTGGTDSAGVAFAAGLAGPVALRSVVVVDRPRGRSTSVGLERRYREWKAFVNERIDQLGAASQAEWVNDVALPRLAGVSLAELHQLTEIYFFDLYTTDLSKAKRAIAPITKVIALDALDEDEKRRRVVVELINSGQRVFVKSLMKRSRAAVSPSTERSK